MHLICFRTGLLLLLVFLQGRAFAQSDSLMIASAKAYARYVDSVEKLDYTKGLSYSRSIADGVFKRRRKTIAGFSVYSLYTERPAFAVRIHYHDNLHVNISKNYYYKNDELVMAVISLAPTTTNAASIYSREMVFSKGQVVWEQVIKDDAADKFAWKTNFPVYEDGIKYLEDFKKDHNQ